MREKLICEYCKKEIKNKKECCHNGRYDEPYYEGRPVWHLDCYSKAIDEAREYI